MMNYGKELIIDLHHCNPEKFTRKSIKEYFKKLCVAIGMEPEKLCWWDDFSTPEKEKETEPHLVGTSAVQFIKTSNITIHTLDIMKTAYINIFSCKDFNDLDALQISVFWFEGTLVKSNTIERI